MFGAYGDSTHGDNQYVHPFFLYDTERTVEKTHITDILRFKAIHLTFTPWDQLFSRSQNPH